jgi:hypothetical protein
MNVHAAVRSNFRYLPLWKSALPQIYPTLGFTSSCPTEYGFAEAVAKWQGSAVPPLSADGILGPVTWKRMKGSLGISFHQDTATAMVADWGGPQCFAPARPGTTPIDHVLLARNRMVEETLFGDAQAFYQAGDFRWFFTLAHAHITRQINSNLNLFQRPNALLRLNLNFAEEFIRALNGQPHEGWRHAFQFCKTLQQNSKSNPLLFGEVEFCGARMANVHIHIDLAHALNEVGCIPPEDYANVLVFVNRGALAATIELRGKFLGVNEIIANQFIAPLVNLDVKAWRNTVYRNACNAVVPEPEQTFRPAVGG